MSYQRFHNPPVDPYQNIKDSIETSFHRINLVNQGTTYRYLSEKNWEHLNSIVIQAFQTAGKPQDGVGIQHCAQWAVGKLHLQFAKTGQF